MKICQSCREEKSLEEFKRNRKTPDGRTYVCIECAKRRRATPVEGLTAEDRRQRDLARLRERATTEPEYLARRKAAVRKTTYGLTGEQYQNILDVQGGVCAICKRPPEATGGRGGLQVDHCHDTNMIRGLLCFHCNAGLGHFKHDVTLLMNAVRYLEDPPVQIVRRLPERRKKAACGTMGGYNRHRTHDEPICEECLAAKREYERKRRAEYRESAGPKKVAQCGTPSGYSAHYYRGEKPCADCKMAMAEYQAGRRRKMEP